MPMLPHARPGRNSAKPGKMQSLLQSDMDRSMGESLSWFLPWFFRPDASVMGA